MAANIAYLVQLNTLLANSAHAATGPAVWDYWVPPVSFD